MAQPHRLLTRQSLLALIVAYLRTQATDTSKFSFANPLPVGAFPMMQMVWTFVLGSELYQARYTETEKAKLPLGVTVVFKDERADQSRAIPQLWTAKICVYIRVQARWDGSSAAHEIAQLIDRALFQSNGFIKLTDYSVNPAVAVGDSLTWKHVPRGDWEFTEDDGLQEMKLEFDAQYTTSPGAGF
jgi:hypothetical protein